MLDRGGVRLARAATFASVAVALSATAHVTGGGGPPRVGVLGLGFGAVLAVAVLVSGRRIGRLAMLGLLAGSQIALHTTFGVLGSTPTGSHCLSGDHHAAHATACEPGAMAGHAASGGAAMLLAHAAATLALALVLARGEQILWTLAAALGLTLPTRPTAPAPTRRQLPRHTGPTRPRVALRHVPLLRGPPQVALSR
ncbi:hypothetical protein [Luteipulveratus halotolerans]|uniref:hypothetical protein n=1 Tax=Luteipulveratus halotolerans TaxID=1631356 RepID=UPI0006813130|nr:hypothetical protein [Luteipulveratus halotolerans]